MIHRFLMFPKNLYLKKTKKELITIILAMLDKERMMVKEINIQIKNIRTHLVMIKMV